LDRGFDHGAAAEKDRRVLELVDLEAAIGAALVPRGGELARVRLPRRCDAFLNQPLEVGLELGLEAIEIYELVECRAKLAAVDEPAIPEDVELVPLCFGRHPCGPVLERDRR